MRNPTLVDLIVTPYPSDEILKQIEYEQTKGKLHILLEKYGEKYGRATNLNLPYREGNHIRDLIIINDPLDVERIAQKHIKKMPNLKEFVYDSIISTTDVEHWVTQRQNYQPAFSVTNELIKLIPISNERAKLSKILLWEKCDFGNKEVDIYEFFLNETLAQLHLAMFGFSNEFQERTNKRIRKSFRGEDQEYAREYVVDMLKEAKQSAGPLSKAIQCPYKSKSELFGNAIIFTYAGHDTTANTLTWCIYEIAKNPFIQTKLQEETDLFFYEQGEKEIEYIDLKRLPYMTRCIMESLRLWTAIPNGTFRELEEDEYIVGKNLGSQVKIPKGTYIQIPNWTRHRNPELWGNDANEFNPDRNFKEDELWNNTVINTYNPNSDRFSPFTYGPRDCIGKNFSQIEMRLILLYLVKNYHFIPTLKQQTTFDSDNLSFNTNTLGPRNIYNTDLTQKDLGMFVNISLRNENGAKL